MRIRTRVLKNALPTVAIAVLAFAGQMWVGPVAAQAAINCLSSESNYFDGYVTYAFDNTANTFEGTGAQIQVNNGPICDTGDQTQENFHFVWVMIAQYGGTGYVQSGYLRYWGGCTYWTTEYNRGGSDTFHRSIDRTAGCKTFGSNHYQVKYDNSTGYEQMLVDGAVLNTTPWDIYAVWPINGNRHFLPEYSAETKYIGDDVPGTSSNTTYMHSAQAQQFNDQFTTSVPGVQGTCAKSPVRYARSSWSDGFTFWSTTSTSTATRC